jgi:hypothetical protein
MSNTTPNMGIPLPGVLETEGPIYAQMVNDGIEILDAHTHTEGDGARIVTSALNIDGDLPFNGFSATLMGSADLSDAGATTSKTRSVYSVGGDLYWNNGGATPVRITNGNALDASSTGGIGGLPSGTASVEYVASKYVFESATNIPAKLDVGGILLREPVASANAITLSSPTGLAADYEVTFPPAVPASTAFLTMDNAGDVAASILTAAGIINSMIADNAITSTKIMDSQVTTAKITDTNVTTGKLANSAVTAAKIANANVLRTKLEAVGQVTSVTETNSFGLSSTTWADIPNAVTPNLVTTGTSRPIMVTVHTTMNDANSGSLGATFAAADVVEFRILVTGSASDTLNQQSVVQNSTVYPNTTRMPLGGMNVLYVPGISGTFGFKLQYRVVSGSATVSAFNFKLTAYEL